jgi:hypothetical protein
MRELAEPTIVVGRGWIVAERAPIIRWAGTGASRRFALRFGGAIKQAARAFDLRMLRIAVLDLDAHAVEILLNPFLEMIDAHENNQSNHLLFDFFKKASA